MHKIVENFITDLTVKAFMAKVEARATLRENDTELASTADEVAPLSSTAQPALATEVAGPNRAQRRHAIKNPKPGEKKKRLGGYGLMIQSYFDQRRALARDEKRLAKQEAVRAIWASHMAASNNLQTA